MDLILAFLMETRGPVTKHIDYQQAQRKGGMNSGQAFVVVLTLPLRSCSQSEGGEKGCRDKWERASHCAMGQMRGRNGGEEHSPSVST